MTSCEHCNGQCLPDEDGASCLQCGRRLYWNANVRDVRVSEVLRTAVTPFANSTLLGTPSSEKLERIIDVPLVR